MTFILKFVPALIFWGIFGYVILQVPYPETLTQADLIQLLSFFIPLFLALTFTFNLIFNFYLRSIILSFGVVLLLVLKALDSLNWVTGGISIAAIILFTTTFKKSRRGLTKGVKIPRLNTFRRRKSE